MAAIYANMMEDPYIVKEIQTDLSKVVEYVAREYGVLIEGTLWVEDKIVFFQKAPDSKSLEERPIWEGPK